MDALYEKPLNEWLEREGSFAVTTKNALEDCAIDQNRGCVFNFRANSESTPRYVDLRSTTCSQERAAATSGNDARMCALRHCDDWVQTKFDAVRHPSELVHPNEHPGSACIDFDFGPSDSASPRKAVPLCEFDIEN